MVGLDTSHLKPAYLFPAIATGPDGYAEDRNLQTLVLSVHREPDGEYETIIGIAACLIFAL